MGLGAAELARNNYADAHEQLQAALAITCELSYHHVALPILTYLAELHLASGRPADAPALLILAVLHPASRSETSERAQRLLVRCQEVLPPERVAAAAEHGRGLDLEAAIALATRGGWP